MKQLKASLGTITALDLLVPSNVSPSDTLLYFHPDSVLIKGLFVPCGNIITFFSYSRVSAKNVGNRNSAGRSKLSFLQELVRGLYISAL